MSFSQETHRDQHRGRTGWRCSGLYSWYGTETPRREQTPSTGDYRRAYRGRTESTKGNIKGGVETRDVQGRTGAGRPI